MPARPFVGVVRLSPAAKTAGRQKEGEDVRQEKTVEMIATSACAAPPDDRFSPFVRLLVPDFC